jgi:hypothetical protein
MIDLAMSGVLVPTRAAATHCSRLTLFKIIAAPFHARRHSKKPVRKLLYEWPIDPADLMQQFNWK